MAAKRRRTARDARRRVLGQNFLTDRSEVNRLIAATDIQPGELIVEIGAGKGAITLPMARAGARVMAIERDRSWAGHLRAAVDRSGLDHLVDVVRDDFRSVPSPTEPFRVVSNPPFGLTTAIMGHLFDSPTNGPWRADLLVQLEVARKRAATPPTSLRSAAWAPWWAFEMGPTVSRTSFRPMPKVDAAMLIARRRDPTVLPEWLAPKLRELLRPGWDPPQPER